MCGVKRLQPKTFIIFTDFLKDVNDGVWFGLKPFPLLNTQHSEL